MKKQFSNNGSPSPEDEYLKMIFDKLGLIWRLISNPSDPDNLGLARAHCLDCVDLFDEVIGL
jgi:hypothetical protein